MACKLGPQAPEIGTRPVGGVRADNAACVAEWDKDPVDGTGHIAEIFREAPEASRVFCAIIASGQSG